jgi:hypothetical protein
MRLQNLIRIASLALVLTIASPAIAGSIPDARSTSCCPDQRAAQLISRLENMRDTNKATITKSERQNLRKEVKQIRKELKSLGDSHFSLSVAIMIMFLLNLFIA